VRLNGDITNIIIHVKFQLEFQSERNQI